MNYGNVVSQLLPQQQKAPQKKQLRKGTILAHGFGGVQCIMAKKVWQSRGSSLCGSKNREQGNASTELLFPFPLSRPLACWMVPPIFNVCLHSGLIFSGNFLTDTLKCNSLIFEAILNPVKLTMKICYYRSPIQNFNLLIISRCQHQNILSIGFCASV